MPFKNYRLIILLIFWILWTSFRSPSITRRNYDISVAGIKVGNLVATREIDGNYTTYTLNSDASVYLLRTYRIKEDLKAFYKNNILQYATVNSTEGKHKYYSSIVWTTDHYDISINGYKFQYQGSLSVPIEYSVARIYFEEPNISGQIFSEDYGVFSNVVVVKPHIDQLIFLGKSNKFYYSNGFMVKAEMHSAIKDFIISYKN